MQAALNLKNVLLKPEGSYQEELYNLVEKFRRDQIVKPHYQREYVWSQSKATGWINRIRSDRHPVGVIILYQIDNGQPSPVYVSDGVQRLSASLSYLLNADKYGDTEQSAREYLESCIMSVQFRHYTTHDEAWRDFQGINNGTILTTHERYKGLITNVPDYAKVWKPILERLRDGLQSNADRISVRRNDSRHTMHKIYRDYWLLLIRWLSEDGKVPDALTYNTVSDKHYRRGQYVEAVLRELLNSTPPEEMRGEAERLVKYSQNVTSDIEYVWRELLHRPVGEMITDSAHAWLNHAAVYKKRQGIANADWMSFLEAFLREGNGMGKFVVQLDDGSHKTLTLHRGRLLLGTVCRILGSDFHELPRKRNGYRRLAPGYDNSHKLPFSENGEGETFPEPASINRARGAKPVDEGQP